MCSAGGAPPPKKSPQQELRILLSRDAYGKGGTRGYHSGARVGTTGRDGGTFSGGVNQGNTFQSLTRSLEGGLTIDNQ